MPPELNSQDWWELKAKGYQEHGDLRDRPDEFREAAAHCGSPLIEIGCAFGQFTKYLNVDAQYVGVDVSALLIDAARRRHPKRIFLCGDIREMYRPFSQGFHTAVAFQVLEHFENPVYVADVCRFIARSRLIFSVPRGLPGPHKREHDGHLSGWKDEAAFEKQFGGYDEITFWPGDPNHICGMMRWDKPLRS